MAEASQHEFDLHVLAQLEKLFGEDDLELMVRREDMAVLVKHLPSGNQASCELYPTQIKNKICCLLTLLLDRNLSS